MRTYRVMIIDDDETAIDELVRALAKYPQFEVAGSCRNTVSGYKMLMAEHPDLLFLDVELPDMQGVEFFNSIQDKIIWDMRVVFYSSYSKYILSAMRESAFDYLLKPFEQKELDGIVERYMKYMAVSNSQMMHRVQGNVSQHNFLVSTVTGYKMVRVEDIGCFEHNNVRKLWTIFLNDGSQLTLKRGTSAEDILNYSPSFVQICQSIIININYLALIEGKTCCLYPPFDKRTDLVISRGYLKKLQEVLNFI